MGVCQDDVQILCMPHRRRTKNMYYESEFQISDEEDKNIFKAVVLRRVMRE